MFRKSIKKKKLDEGRRFPVQLFDVKACKPVKSIPMRQMSSSSFACFLVWRADIAQQSAHLVRNFEFLEEFFQFGSTFEDKETFLS